MLVAWEVVGWVLVFLYAVANYRLSMTTVAGRDGATGRFICGERRALWLVIGVGVFLRVALVAEFQDGRLTSDENLMAIVYTSGIVHGDPVRFGAEKVVSSLILDGWMQLFGPSPLAIRALSTSISLLGLALWCIALRRLAGWRVAMWGTGLLSISVFGIYFGRLGMEMYWVLFLGALLLWLYALWLEKKAPGTAFVGGLVAGLGFFTYPGFILGVLALLAGLSIAWLWSLAITRRAGGRGNGVGHTAVFHAGLAFVGLSIPLALGVWSHVQIFASPDEPIFAGGGHLDLSLGAILSALAQQLKDLFIEGSSWYLVFPSMPFVELVLWPFFVVGLWRSWGDSESWKVRGVALSIPLVLFLSAFTGPYPGVRRSIYLLLPFYFFAAMGIVWFLSAANASAIREGLYGTAKRGVFALVFVLFGVAHIVYYQLDFGRAAVSWNFGAGFGTNKIPMDSLLGWLEDKDVILSEHEFGVYFDHWIYMHYPKLARRYGLISPGARDVHFIEDAQSPVIRTLRYRDDWRYLSWSGDGLETLSRHVGFCVNAQAVGDATAGDARDLLFVAYRNPVANNRGPRGAGPVGCFERGDSIIPDARFDMGYRRADERLRHRLVCAGGHCDKTRPDFLYTRGGAVSFVLGVQEGVCESGCVLEFQLRNPAPGRKSVVRGGGKRVGVIDLSSINAKNRVRFPIAASSVDNDGRLEVEIIEAEGGRLGWDVDYARIVASD